MTLSKQAEAWDGQTQYYRGDEVTHHGVTFRAMEAIFNPQIEPYVTEFPTRWEKVEKPVETKVETQDKK